MNWIADRKKSLEWSIKFTSKGLACQLGVLLLNVFGMSWNGYFLYYYGTTPIASGFGLGAFASNFLWTLCQCVKWYGDIKSEKSELKFLNELELKEKLNEDREYYQKARKTYEDFFTRQNVVGGDTKAEPEISGCGDSFVCKQADVQNCH